MKKLFTLFFAIAAVISINAQTTLASWSFENLVVPTTSVSTTTLAGAGFTGSFVADAGAATTGSAVTASHATACTYSTPGGNGSLKALSSNTWAVGDYYQFKVATTGYSGIKTSWDQTGSNTGPAPFKLQYSTTAGGAAGYTDIKSYTLPNRLPSAVGAVTWSTVTPIAFDSTTFTADLSAITAVNDKAEVYFRVVCTAVTAIGSGATSAAGGTGRIDNFKVTYNGTIPVEMTSFTAKKAGNVNKLIWQTATERDNARFDVQRSNDGSTFQNIGQVKGAGTSVALNNYEFMDETPSVGTNYYRLQQVDANGTTTTSKTVALNANGKGTVKVFPTLATDKINVLTASNQEENFTITNLVGQTVLSGRVVNALDINVSQLAKGNYILNIAGDAVQFSKQ